MQKTTHSLVSGFFYVYFYKSTKINLLKTQNIKILYNKCINITYFLINGEFQMVVVEKQNHLNSFENFDSQLIADSEQVEHFAQDMLL